MAGIFGKLFSEEQRELSALEKIADQVLKYEPEMQALSDDELRAKTDEYRKRIADGETVDDLLPEAFATAREAAYRVINEKPYKVQIMGSVAMHKGDILDKAKELDPQKAQANWGYNRYQAYYVLNCLRSSRLNPVVSR